jgi:hypothetical protein
LVTPKARAKHEPFVQQTGLKSVTATSFVNFVTFKVGTKNELLFNKSASGRISRMWPLQKKKWKIIRIRKTYTFFRGGERNILDF